MMFFILQGDTTQLIYSFHNEDPVDNEQFTQHQFQGSMVINLFGQQENVPPLPDNVQQFEIRLENVRSLYVWACLYYVRTYLYFT